MISAPSDVASDVEVVIQCLDETNKILAGQGIEFKSFHWINDARPGAGRDAQTRINEQTEHIDAIIALFGAKIGTPTQSFPSGTVEEIETALSKKSEMAFGDDGIVILFKDVNLGIDSDLKSASALQDYRASLSSNGVLYKKYSEDSELRSAVSSSIGGWLKSIQTYPPGRQLSEPGDSKLPTDDEEPGFLELEFKAGELFGELATTIGSLSGVMSVFPGKLSQLTSDLSSRSALGDRVGVNQIISQICEEMKLVSSQLSNTTIQLKDRYEQAIQAYAKSIQIQSEDFGHDHAVEQNNAIRSSLLKLNDTFNKNVSQFSGLQSATMSLPRMTSELNRTKRIFSQAIGDYIAQIEAMINSNLVLIATRLTR